MHADSALDTTNTEKDSEMKKEAEQMKSHWMAKVYDFLEMLQGSQNLRATQKKSRAQNKQMTAVGYISDTEEIIKACWSLFHHDGAAAFKLSERSPLPPAFSAKDLPRGRTQILKVRLIRRINRHLIEVVRIAHLKGFRTPNIGLTGMGTWIFQMTAKTNVRQTLNLI